MRVLLVAAAAAMAAVCGSQPSLAATQAQAADEAEDLFAAYDASLYAGKYDEALTYASLLSADDGDRSERARVLGMRGAALLGLKQPDESARLFAQADALAPQEPYPTKLRFRIALLTGNVGVAADSMDRMIARFPDVAREIEWQTLVFFLSKVSKSEARRNEDRLIALARLGYGADSDTGDEIAQQAVAALVKRGDVAGAQDLLRYIDEPGAVQTLLVQKRYAALWPALEERAGPHLQKVIASSVSNAERAYAADPSDPEKLALLVEAYRGSGRLDDAIALRSKLPATFVNARIQTGWAANGIALALNAKGRIEEADRLFADIIEAEHTGGTWRISMKVNRVESLIFDGQFERALPLLEPTQAAAQKEGNPYAQQLVRRLRYCAYHRLGQADKASAILPELLAKASDSPAATIDGLLCAGRVEDAEKVALAALADEAFEAQFVRMLHPGMLVGQRATAWSEEWNKLAARPSVAAAYKRLGRDLPDQFLVGKAP